MQPSEYEVAANVFVGPEELYGSIAKNSPNVVVKSDADPAILGAVYDFGWHSEPSLANTWPHNTAHERWQGSVKSVCRAAMLQSGLPGKTLNW